jgi:hypothetical protein
LTSQNQIKPTLENRDFAHQFSKKRTPMTDQ